MRIDPILALSVVAFACGCGSAGPSQSRPSESSRNTESTPRTTVYATGDGTAAWHIQGRHFWNGSPVELRVAPLGEAPATVNLSREGAAACVSLDGVMAFGAPDQLQEGVRFRCGAARFEVAQCDVTEQCRNARIEAIWRTGSAPDYRELPISYFYNRCRGVQSITFSLERPLAVGFGSTLELRQGLGLLAQPHVPLCTGDPASSLYTDAHQ